MNESAILHIPDSQYCFAVGEKKLVIRLRMAKEDADASVTLIYAGKYQFQQSREQIPMEIRYTDRLYHYYETTLVLTDVRPAFFMLSAYPAAGHDVLLLRGRRRLTI